MQKSNKNSSEKDKSSQNRTTARGRNRRKESVQPPRRSYSGLIWLVGLLLLVLAIGGLAYTIVTGVRASAKHAQFLEEVSILSYHADVSIQSNAESAFSSVSLSEKIESLLQAEREFTGYNFVLPYRYIRHDGVAVALNPSQLTGKVNGVAITPEVEVDKKSDRIIIATKTAAETINAGKNTLQLHYELDSLPLRDQDGKYSFQWKFPAPTGLVVKNASIAITLPAFVTAEQANLSAKVITNSDQSSIPVKTTIKKTIEKIGNSESVVFYIRARDLSPSQTIKVRVEWAMLLSIG